MVYYNENDPKAAAWLRALIGERIIPKGDIDERSILEVRPHELAGYSQQHFFAGIGGWAYALQLSGWPEDMPVRTGSCPCQPFSISGKGLGQADKRHLWPVFRDLITFGESTVTFGEQVASPLGREWLAGVRADLEGLGYEVGAADLCAAGLGAPHIRQRLYWVGQPYGTRRNTRQPATTRTRHGNTTKPAGGNGRMDDSSCSESTRLGPQQHELHAPSNAWSDYSTVQCSDGKARRFESCSFPLAYGVPGRVGLLRGYGNAIVPQVAAEFIKAYLENKDAVIEVFRPVVCEPVLTIKCKPAKEVVKSLIDQLRRAGPI